MTDPACVMQVTPGRAERRDFLKLRQRLAAAAGMAARPSVRARAPSRGLAQERADFGVEVRQVDQEGVMPLERGQAHEAGRNTVVLEGFGDCGLLLDREQQVALDTDDQRAL